MKTLSIKSGVILILICVTIAIQAQIYGNGKMKTITVPLENLKNIDIQFNADIVIDYLQEETMTIRADENVIAFIGHSLDGRKLTLDQIEWIEPSKQPTIKIGVKELKEIYQGTHSTTWVKNIDRDKFIINGNVGDVVIEGKLSHLKVNVEQTNVDARDLMTTMADITIEGNGKVVINQVKDLKAKIGDNSQLVRLSEPANYIGMSKGQLDGVAKNSKANPTLKYINFKIKNNSWNRNHFVVVGPKRDGSSFSYGFPMMPYTSKSEKWTIGTKIYKENKIGVRELLVTIEESDENQTVKLFGE